LTSHGKRNEKKRRKKKGKTETENETNKLCQQSTRKKESPSTFLFPFPFSFFFFPFPFPFSFFLFHLPFSPPISILFPDDQNGGGFQELKGSLSSAAAFAINDLICSSFFSSFA